MNATAFAAVPAILVVTLAWPLRRAVLVASGSGPIPLVRSVPPRLHRVVAFVRGGPSAGSELGDLVRLRAALAAGGSIVHALADVGRGRGPWAPASRRAAAQVRAGLPLDEALDGWAEQVGPVGVLAGDALVLATATGASVVGALEAAIEVARVRDGLQREVRMLSAPARASALLVAAAPVAFAVLLAIADVRVRGFLLGTWAGAACVVTGLALDLAGGWWMARLVRQVA